MAVTIASRHLPFVYSTEPNGGNLHRVAEVRLHWNGGRFSRHSVTAACAHVFGSHTRFVSEPDGYRWCARCGIDLPVQTAPVVYVGWVGELIKVGYTKQLHIRRHDLEMRVIRTTPGGRELEKRVLAAAAPHLRRGQEVFDPACLPAVMAVMAESEVA